MSPSELAALALAQPGAVESAHFGKRDFRVGGKIFMTLPSDAEAVFSFAPDQQALMCELYPDAIAPVPNAWGLKGWTRATLALLDERLTRHLVEAAWEKVAPKSLKNRGKSVS